MAKKEGQLAFLKEYARDVGRDYEDVADLFDALAEDLDKAYEIVTHFCARVIETEAEEDFPAKILVFYNEGITNPKERLKAEEVKKLRSLVERYGQGLEKHRLGKERLISKKNLNEDSNRRGNQSTMQTERPQTSTSASTVPGAPPLEFETEGQLLDWILENNGVREDKRMRIMHMFEAQKQALMANPQSFWYFLQDSLTPQAANATYHAFMRMGQQYVLGWQYRQQYAQQTNALGPNGMPMQPGMGMMGGTGGMGMGMGMGQQQTPFGMPGMGGQGQGGTLQEYLSALMFEDRMEDRRYRRHDRQMGDYMGMNFSKMMEGGQGQGGQGGNNMNPMMMAAAGLGSEVIYDEDGRVKGVRYMPGAGNKNDGNNTLLTTFMNNTQSMINTLLSKDGAGGSGQWEKIFQFLVQREDKRTDPLEMARNMKELVTTFGGGSKTIDEVKLLLDAKLGLKHEDREDAKLQHEWEMQKLEKTDQSDMMKQYLQTIMGLKDEVLPYIAAFLKGGQANRAGLQRQPMPSPYGATTEMAQQQAQAQAQAQQAAAYNVQMQAAQEAQAERAQQQYYQQRMGMGMPQQQPQQYEYAPPPQEEEEQTQPQQINQQQLYQLSPEQLMEVRGVAEQRINEVGNVVDMVNQEFARRNQMIARMQQRAAQHAEAQEQQDTLEFNPTRTSSSSSSAATQLTNPEVQAQASQQSIYVSMENENDNNTSASDTEFPGGVTIAYDPVKDRVEEREEESDEQQQEGRDKKGFVHSEDFSSSY